jgi:Zn-dependent alcohol dehydrogenase
LKAALLVELNKPLEVCEVSLTSLEIGQVLVKILVSGVCGSQLHEISGNKGNGKFLPHLMGHEGCGIVEEIGLGVTTVKVGDKVVMHWRPGLGIEAGFPKYKRGEEEFSSGKVTTLSEKAIVSENRITSVPLTTDPEVAALLGCSLTTALGVINNDSGLKFGERVAIIGCGGVGINLVTAAHLGGAGAIFAVDQIREKETICRQHGATHFFQKPLDIFEKVDVVIDTTGNPSIISEAINLLSDTGRLILVGQPSPQVDLVIPNALQLFNGQGQSIRATQGGGTVPHTDIPRYLRLFDTGRINIKDLITHRYDLNDINVAFDVLRSGKAGRIMIQIAEEVK